MADGLILGFDIGTTSVKAGLINRNGALVSYFNEAYPTQRPEKGFAEQNPEDWQRLIHKAIAYFDNEGYSNRISCIGLCSQVNTHVFVAENGQPLMPAIVWQDGRASQQALRLDHEVTLEQKINWWGAPMPIDASNVLSRMAWVAETQPDIWAKTKWVLLPKDYCIAELTGKYSTDPISNIGLVGADHRYISDVFDLVPGSSQKISPLASILEKIGVVKDGSPLAGVPIVSGTMDAWAGILGAGGAKDGSSVYLSGTSEILGIASKIVVPTPGVVVFPEVADIRLHAAPTQSGGDAKMWFSSVSGLSMEQISNLVSDTPRSSATPLFLPQLEGERAPVWDADLRGAFLGLSRQSGINDMARAVYEGVAFSVRHALEALQDSADIRSDKLFCAGGGFRSDSWNQIRADVLGKELHILTAGEPGILGAGMIAAVGTGIYEDLEQASNHLVQYDRLYTPSKKAYQEYDRIFSLYKKGIELNAEISKQVGTSDI